MVFSSVVFLFFFLPVCLLGYYVLFRRSVKWKNRWLLFCSLFFYAWGGIQYLGLILLSIGVNWLVARAIRKRREQPPRIKRYLVYGLCFNLLVLFVFKYLGFFVSNLNLILPVTIPVPEIVLPIGISFFTFQGMSYIIDVYRNKAEALDNPLDVGLYISFFPQLIAGPIVRYDTVAAQIRSREETSEKFSVGIQRFVLGLAKKAVLANSVAVLAKYAFEGEYPNSVLLAWLGAIAYMLQIYFDFSGYSDMAIGLGKMFGFDFQENFDRPYGAASISEFWRRWHISMGTWFRDYVYFPLGGSRVPFGRMIFNLFAVWMLTGLWHGANWTFVLWGLFQFVIIVSEKFIARKGKGQTSPVGRVFSHLYTLLAILFGWVLFRSASVAGAMQYFGSMLGLNGLPFANSFSLTMLREYAVALSAGILLCIPIDYRSLTARFGQKGFRVIGWAVVGCFFLLSVIYIVKGSYNPFIYFNF